MPVSKQHDEILRSTGPAEEKMPSVIKNIYLQLLSEFVFTIVKGDALVGILALLTNLARHLL